MTWTGSSRRTTAVLAVVVAALLVSSYAMGRTLGLDQLGHNPTRAAGDSGGVQHADQPEAGSAGPATRDHSASPPDAGQDGATRNAAGDGLFGAHATTGTRRIALTFDDGPDPQFTPQVLTVLRRFEVRATFCLVGENAQKHPDLVRAIVADGHTLCNHSWNHNISLGNRSPKDIRADLLRTNAAIRAAVPGAPIMWYRQPGGVWTYPLVSVAHELGMTSLHWSVDPSDWQAPGADRIASMVMSRIRPGAVVLLHDGGGNRQGTVNALDRILPDLAARFELTALPTEAK
ncbi:polysaccharide deacetylase family protein [Micromonospora sp. NPDC006431]|uniref:polysaccharide deacetylase family protein n=1 Tax=Micromonospora sp. NPDC006431 TaxID=3364235 RepID=UPI003694DA7C